MNLTLVLVAVLAAMVAIPYAIPKRQVLSINSEFVGYYYGLGLTSETGYFGRNWFRIVVSEGTEDCWEVDIKRIGYNPYRGYYPNGVLREEGQCFVAENDGGIDIYPVRENVLNARYYDPSGKLISEIVNKTGKQVLCYPDGQRMWELDLVDGKYSRVKTWYRNGQMAYEISYEIGLQHGYSISWSRDGTLRRRTRYFCGQDMGEFW